MLEAVLLIGLGAEVVALVLFVRAVRRLAEPLSRIEGKLNHRSRT